MSDVDNKIILRTEKVLQKSNWKVKATSRNKKGRELISEILNKFEIKDMLYHPNVLVEKDDMKLFLIVSEKTKFPISNRKGEQKIVSGIDFFKYKLSQYIESVTGIQVGLIMYSKETGELIIRQMNQLPPPILWFSSEGCLLNALKSYYKNPTDSKKKRLGKVYKKESISKEEDKELDDIDNFFSGKLKQGESNTFLGLKCIECYQKYPLTCHRCIKGKNKRIKVMAIWNVENFEQKKLTVQPQLLLSK